MSVTDPFKSAMVESIWMELYYFFKLFQKKTSFFFLLLTLKLLFKHIFMRNSFFFSVSFAHIQQQHYGLFLAFPRKLCIRVSAFIHIR